MMTIKSLQRRKTCDRCGSRKIERVGYLVDVLDFEGVKVVHEDFEHTLEKPGPVVSKMGTRTFIKLSILLSLFFTPLAGPLMALAIKLLYDGKIDKEETKEAYELWKRQGFCFKCGITWKEII